MTSENRGAGPSVGRIIIRRNRKVIDETYLYPIYMVISFAEVGESVEQDEEITSIETDKVFHAVASIVDCIRSTLLSMHQKLVSLLNGS